MLEMNLRDESRLTTDPVRPGEQWFCYWKTSAALWEQRIREIPAHETVFIPVFWGFHAGPSQRWDFGEQQPELDLARLVHLLTQHGRKFCWLLPLTPAPFLPNGGIPISTARTLALSEEGLLLASFDMDGTLHKMYSFFEPKVFSAFSSFTSAFGQYLAENKIKTQVWGVKFFYPHQNKNHIFLEDRSVAFEQGFSRFLKKTHPEGVELTDATQEEELKQDFVKEVEALFTAVAAEALAPFWAGTKAISVLGSSPTDTLERGIMEGRSQLNTFKEIFDNYVHGRWFSTALLAANEKRELTRKCLDEHFGVDEIEHQFNFLSHNHDLPENFRANTLVEIFDPTGGEVFKRNGLVSFLDKNFRWMYNIRPEITFTPQALEASLGRIKIFHAKGMDRTHFSQMLKLFLMGEKVIFDRSGLSSELDKRLQIFYLENNLNIQQVNFLTSVSLCSLGEGQFISFDGDPLKLEDQNRFWIQLFEHFKLQHPKVDIEDGVFALWRIRATSPHELNYLDVRRVNLYNPTSYKKPVSIHTLKKFAFMKVVDPFQATAKTTSEGVEIEILPGGRVALDFGHYEEK